MKRKSFAAIPVVVFCLLSLFSCGGGGGGDDDWFWKLPDSGQSTCFDMDGNQIACAGTGQDGEYSINPISLTANGNGTVTDNRTGLIWAVQDDGTTRPWAEAIAYCEDLTLGGATNWRLPTYYEIQTIANYGLASPAVDAVFDLSTGDPHWTSSEYVHDTTLAWDFYAVDGEVVHDYKATEGFSLCVR